MNEYVGGAIDFNLNPICVCMYREWFNCENPLMCRN